MILVDHKLDLKTSIMQVTYPNMVCGGLGEQHRA